MRRDTPTVVHPTIEEQIQVVQDAHRDILTHWYDIIVPGFHMLGMLSANQLGRLWELSEPMRAQLEDQLRHLLNNNKWWTHPFCTHCNARGERVLVGTLPPGWVQAKLDMVGLTGSYDAKWSGREHLIWACSTNCLEQAAQRLAQDFGNLLKEGNNGKPAR